MPFLSDTPCVCVRVSFNYSARRILPNTMSLYPETAREAVLPVKCTICVCQSLFQLDMRVASSQTPSLYIQKQPEKLCPSLQVHHVCVHHVCVSESLSTNKGVTSSEIPHVVCIMTYPAYGYTAFYYICRHTRLESKQSQHQILGFGGCFLYV